MEARFARIVNEVKFNASWNGQRIPMVGDAWKRSTYGFQFPLIFNASSWAGAGGTDGVPDITISNFANINGPRQALMSPTTDFQWMDNFTMIKGSHTLKAGVTVIRNRKDQNGRSAWRGNASFSTSGNNNSTGNALADALLGNFRTYTEASGDPVGFFRFTSYEGYVSDGWKVNRRFSMELGVRWQRNTPTYTQANNSTNFVASRYDPSQAVTIVGTGGTIVPGSGNRYNGLVRAGDGIVEDEMPRLAGLSTSELALIPAGAPRGLYQPQLLFAPRFSFAYVPFNHSTAIRGGFGMFYDKPEGNLVFSMVNYAPWLQSVNIENGNLRNPAGGTAAALTPMGNIDAIDPGLQTPYTITGNFGVQRELPKGMFFEMTYVGTFGRHLIRQPNINSLGLDELRALNAIPSAQRPSQNSLRPYKGYSEIRMRLSDSTSNYHALQTYLTRRKGRLKYTFSYTWSKVLSDVSGNGDNPDGGIFWRDRHYSYGPASFDRSHVFVATYTYNVPMFHSAFRNSVAKAALTGWELSGIVRAQTGAPLTITAGTALTATRRADYVGGPAILNTRDPNGYLNAEAFAPAPDDREGNTGAGILRGPGLYLWDLSLRKEFGIARDGKWKLRYQADFFNLFNRVNLRNPTTGWGSRFDPNENFGTVTTAGPSRNIQMGLKFTF